MQTLSEVYCDNVSNAELAELLKKAILEGADLTERGFSYGSLVGTVNEKDLVQIYLLLKERAYVLRETIVFDLVHRGYFNLLIQLVSDHYDVNTRDVNGENALSHLVKKYNEKGDFAERLKIALQMGIDHTVVNVYGDNLLHCFAQSGNPDYYLTELLTLKLDINKVNKHGWTPLHLLCVNSIDDEAIEMLIAHGADLNIRTSADVYLEGLEEMQDGGRHNAYELRIKYLDSLGGEYEKGTAGYAMLEDKYKKLLKQSD